MSQLLWSKNATMLLVKLYLERKAAFIDPHLTSKRSLWNDVAEKMAESGVPGLNAFAVSRKFRNLRRTYDKIVLKNKSKNGPRRASRWEFFEIMDEIFQQNQPFAKLEHEPESESESESSVSSAESEPLASMVKNKANDEEEPISWDEFNNSEVELLDGKTETDPVLVCPSDTSTKSSQRIKRKRKANNQKDLYYFNKKTLQIEKARNEELIKIRMALENANTLQAERNEILRSLFKQVSNK